MHPYIHSSVMYNSQVLETAYVPISKWVDPKTGTFLQWNTMQQKERTPILYDSMDGTGEHYAKWNKPDSKRQIPYDLTFKWNLINKTNKQAKYNQKHWN